MTSFVFLLISRKYMLKYDEARAKRYIICSMLAIGWILVYDLIFFISSMPNISNVVFLSDGYFLGEMILILYFGLLSVINKNLSKADNPTKYKESTDWFYEKYEDK